MFTIIDPKDHPFYQKRIAVFLDLLKVYQNFTVPLEELKNASFVIASDHNHGVYGGALLLKKSLWDLKGDIRKTALILEPDSGEVWTGRVGFYKEAGGSFSGKKALEAYLDFACDLLNIFHDFGHRQGIHYLFLTLTEAEYLRGKNYGILEYIHKIPPQESTDGLFHGIISLVGRNQ